MQTCLRMGYQYVRRTGARVYGVVNLSAAESVLPVPIAQFNNKIKQNILNIGIDSYCKDS